MNWWKKFIKSQYEHYFGNDLNNEIRDMFYQIEELKEQVRVLKNLVNQDESALIQPDKLAEISIFELRMLLYPYCKNLHLSDKTYSLTSVEKAKKFSEETKVFTRKWIREQHDCDEFSSALNGYWNDGLKQFAFGIAWSKPHAFNIMVDDKRQIWIVEPMTNKFTKIEDMKDNSKYYPLTLVLI